MQWSYMLLFALALSTAFASSDSNEKRLPVSNTENKLRKDEFNKVYESILSGAGPRRILSGAGSRRVLDQILDESDFASVNEILDGLTIALPPIEESIKLRLVTAGIALTNFKCFDLSFDSIQVLSSQNGNTDLMIITEIFGLVLSCKMDIEWYYGRTDGDGTVEVTLEDNYVGAVTSVSSEDFDNSLPNPPEYVACDSSFQVTDMDFSGDASVTILNFLEGFISDVVEAVIEGEACAEVEYLVEEEISLVFEELNEFLNPSFNPLPDWRLDPLHPEDNLIIPVDGTIVDFESDDSLSGLSAYIDIILREIDNLLGVPIKDYENPYGEEKDLGLNVYIRDLLLDPENQELILFDDESYELYNFSLEDPAMNMSIAIDGLKVSGLDKFTEFEELKVIGSNTLQHHLTLQGVSVKLDLTVRASLDVTPEDDSTVQDFQDEPVVESFSIEFAVEDIHANYSLFVAIDEDALNQISLGYFLNTQDWDDCYIPPVFYDLGVSNLNITVGDVAEPTFVGFSSPGIDALLAEAVDIGFFMYKNAVVNALGSLFQTSVRDLINETILWYQCPPFETTQSDCDIMVDPSGIANLSNVTINSTASESWDNSTRG